MKANERAILGKLIETLINEEFRIEIAPTSVDGGISCAWMVYAAKDFGEKPRDGYAYWVAVIPGNGFDFISDYTTNLEKALKPVFEYVERLEAQDA